MRNNLLIIVLAMFTFASCETDVDVTAPYKTTPIIYGLLDQNDSVHYIKVNKTFLGESSAYTMAQIRDSSEYDPSEISVTVDEIDINGSLIKTYACTTKIITTKDTGVFFAPNQIVYSFESPFVANLSGRKFLNSDNSYRLNVEFSDPTKNVSATTQLINNIDTFTLGGLFFTSPIIDQGLGFATTQYNSIPFEWNPVKDGKSYQLTLTFKYKEVKHNGQSTTKSFDWTFPSQSVSNSSNPPTTELTQDIDGQEFYSRVAQNIKTLTESPDIKYREFKGIDLELAITGDDLHTYIEVNTPTGGLVQEKPEFNSFTNAIGIFSTRTRIKRNGIRLKDPAFAELVQGTLQNGGTGLLGFCDPSSQGNLGCN